MSINTLNHNGNASNEETLEGKRRLNRERQKRKAVAYFLSGENAEWISASDAEGVDEEDVQDYLKMVESGKVGAEQKERFLKRIQGPVDRLGAETVFLGDENGREGIAGNRQEQRILATMTDVGFDNYESVVTEDVKSFLDKYPTPLDFKESADGFLAMIREHNPPAKYEQYVGAMSDFQKKIYGKKYDYFLALDELESEGATKVDEASAEDLSAEEALDSEKERGVEMMPRRRLRRLGEKVKSFIRHEDLAGEKVGRRTGVMTVRRAEIEGAPLYNPETGESELLTREKLERAELMPKFEVKLEGVKYGFSEIFQVSGRDATIGYVEKDGEVYARSYYRSNSQGVWRYLPDRMQDPETGRIVWFGKGMSEEAITLPSEIQKVLSEKGDEFRAPNLEWEEMSERQKMVQRERVRAFYGTAGEVKSKMKRMPEDRKDALSREVNYRAKYNFDNKMSPDGMRKYFDLMPDFDEKVDDYRGKSDIYGEFKANVFESKDRELKWTMLEDAMGRAWVGQIETKAPITSTGCREEWAYGGDLAVPLYEYASQDNGFGDYNDVKGNYVSMWNNYLAKMPLIREFKIKEAQAAVN